METKEVKKTEQKKYGRNKKLTDEEKILIQKMWSNGGDMTEIAKKVKRHHHTVTKYIKDFCKEFEQRISDELLKEEKKKKASDGEAIYEETLQKLIDGGFSEAEARFRLSQVISKLDKPGKVDELYQAALVVANAKEMMVTKTDGGRQIAVMTEAASQRLDDLRSRAKLPKRDTSHIFSTKANG